MTISDLAIAAGSGLFVASVVIIILLFVCRGDMGNKGP